MSLRNAAYDDTHFMLEATVFSSCMMVPTPLRHFASTTV
jgi:hypothetical protein